MLKRTNMNKQRHIKTFAEKYGERSVKIECYDIMKKMLSRNRHDIEKVFSNLPYLGYLYIPVEDRYRRWWHETEQEDFIRAKVVEVTQWGHVSYVYIDDHHWHLATHKTTSNASFDYRVKGNVLIHKDEIEND